MDTCVGAILGPSHSTHCVELEFSITWNSSVVYRLFSTILIVVQVV